MKKLEAVMSSSSIDKLISELDKYEKSLIEKTSTFLSRLADCGISVGEQHTGEYADCIAFAKEEQSVGTTGVKIILKAYDTKMVHKQWTTPKGAIHSDTYSGLYMAEFGSGHHADNKNEVDIGIGQGSLNTYGHAFEDNWMWIDIGTKAEHWSNGETPTYPVYSAYVEMKNQIISIAKEVYGES